SSHSAFVWKRNQTSYRISRRGVRSVLLVYKGKRKGRPKWGRPFFPARLRDRFLLPLHLGTLRADAHAVERAINEEHGDGEEDGRQQMAQSGVLAFHAYRQFHRQQSEQSSEFDHRVHGHRGSVFERISHGIADHGGVVQLGAFLLQLDLHDFLGVVPGAAGVGHEDGLIQAEDGDRDQVADEEERFYEGERQRDKENAEKDVEHAGLRVLGADFNNLFAVGHRRFLHAFQLDVALDEFHRAISAGSHRLHGSAGEPIDDRPTAYQLEHKG